MGYFNEKDEYILSPEDIKDLEEFNKRDYSAWEYHEIQLANDLVDDASKQAAEEFFFERSDLHYKDKLRLPKWHKMRLEVLRRDEWKCTNCGAKDSLLDVHHMNYIRVNTSETAAPWESDSSDLATLCRDCHLKERGRDGDSLATGSRFCTPSWQKLKLHVFERDNWKCRLCGEELSPITLFDFKYYEEGVRSISSENHFTICDNCIVDIQDKKVEKGVLETFLKSTR